jgi:hypothetical protein
MTGCDARWVGVLVLAAVGCSGPTGQPADTGARNAARVFADAIAEQDWSSAYDALDADSRLRRDDFVQQARQYRRNLRFEPASVQVRSCEEQGEEAKAHVVFSGPAKSGSRQFRDSLLLRRGPGGWGVVLSRHFGRTKVR